MRIAVVGATGMVGEVMLQVLAERKFPVTELIPVASEKSVGKKFDFEFLQKLIPQMSLLSSGKQLPKDNLILHPFFDPSVPFSQVELVDMPISSYLTEDSVNYYGRVIVADEKKVNKKNAA